MYANFQVQEKNFINGEKYSNPARFLQCLDWQSAFEENVFVEISHVVFKLFLVFSQHPLDLELSVRKVF